MRVQVEEPRLTATSLLWSGSVGAVSALNQLIMIMFLTYFILLSDKMFKRKFVELAGPRLSRQKADRGDHRQHRIADRPLSHRPDFYERHRRHRDVGGAAVHRPRAGRRCGGCSPAVFNSIPYYGPLIVSGGLSMVAFLQFGTLKMVIAVAGDVARDHFP